MEEYNKITDWAAYHSVEPLFSGCFNYFNTKDKAIQDQLFENLKVRFGFCLAKSFLNRFSHEREPLLDSAINKIITDAGLTIRHIKKHSDIMNQFTQFKFQCRCHKFEPAAIEGLIKLFIDDMKAFEDMLLFKPFLDEKNESELDRDFFIETLRSDTKVSIS
jgi:hypothetical protein